MWSVTARLQLQKQAVIVILVPPTRCHWHQRRPCKAAGDLQVTWCAGWGRILAQTLPTLPLAHRIASVGHACHAIISLQCSFTLLRHHTPMKSPSLPQPTTMTWPCSSSGSCGKGAERQLPSHHPVRLAPHGRVLAGRQPQHQQATSATRQLLHQLGLPVAQPTCTDRARSHAVGWGHERHQVHTGMHCFKP
jgi:hypothetical protein